MEQAHQHFLKTELNKYLNSSFILPTPLQDNEIPKQIDNTQHCFTVLQAPAEKKKKVLTRVQPFKMSEPRTCLHWNNSLSLGVQDLVILFTC